MHRLGPAGAAGRIAKHLQSLLLPTVHSDTSLPDPPRASQA
jgi:hypothetical protein